MAYPPSYSSGGRCEEGKEPAHFIKARPGLTGFGSRCCSSTWSRHNGTAGGSWVWFVLEQPQNRKKNRRQCAAAVAWGPGPAPAALQPPAAGPAWPRAAPCGHSALLHVTACGLLCQMQRWQISSENDLFRSDHVISSISKPLGFIVLLGQITRP